MRKAARRDSAKAWIGSGAVVSVKAYAKRYGVDKYTAYEDLVAVGFPLGERDAHWAQRPPPLPRRREEVATEPIEGWIPYCGEYMYVVGYTPGGAPFGYVGDIHDFDDPD
jgi:hypothetical protein